MIRRLLVFLLLAVVVSVGPSGASADRGAADFFAQRGDKAVKDRKWAEAQSQYAKALEEDERHLPARVGLGDALLGSGDRDAAVEAWRKAVADAKAVDPMPAGWADAVARAKKRLAEVDAGGAALEAMIDKQVVDLLALANRWLVKDPQIAARAANSVLVLRPGNAKATALLQGLGSAATTWTMLLSGKNLQGWTFMREPTWQSLDGAVVGERVDGMAEVRSEGRFAGNFDVRCEAKLLQAHDEGYAILLCAAYKDEHRGTSVGIFRNSVVFWEQVPGASVDEITVYRSEFSKMKHPVDPKEWITLELRFRTTEIHALVNGEEVAVEPRPPDRDEGTIALQVQKDRVAFRRVELAKR